MARVQTYHEMDVIINWHNSGKATELAMQKICQLDNYSSDTLQTW